MSPLSCPIELVEGWQPMMEPKSDTNWWGLRLNWAGTRREHFSFHGSLEKDKMNTRFWIRPTLTFELSSSTAKAQFSSNLTKMVDLATKTIQIRLGLPKRDQSVKSLVFLNEDKFESLKQTENNYQKLEKSFVRKSNSTHLTVKMTAQEFLGSFPRSEFKRLHSKFRRFQRLEKPLLIVKVRRFDEFLLLSQNF